MAKKPSAARKKADAAVAKTRPPTTPAKPKRRSVTPAPELGYSDEQVNQTLFPLDHSAVLLNGTNISIRPWSITMFGVMAQRIPRTFKIAAGDGEDAPNEYAQMFLALADEVIYMVASTCDLDEDDVREWAMEDLLTVSLKIWDVCIAPCMEKIASLLGKVVGSVGAVRSVKTPTAPKVAASSPL